MSADRLTTHKWCSHGSQTEEQRWSRTWPDVLIHWWWIYTFSIQRFKLRSTPNCRSVQNIYNVLNSKFISITDGISKMLRFPRRVWVLWWQWGWEWGGCISVASTFQTKRSLVEILTHNLQWFPVWKSNSVRPTSLCISPLTPYVQKTLQL